MESISLESKFTVPEDVVAREIKDEMVIADLRSGTYFGLNPAGAMVWTAVAAGKPLANAKSELCEHFTVEAATAETDVLAVAAEMRERGLIEPR